VALQRLFDGRADRHFGIYYAPLTSTCSPLTAMRKMDQALEEAAEVAGASALPHLLADRDLPADCAAIISGNAASFVRDAGIYGIPAVWARRPTSR